MDIAIPELQYELGRHRKEIHLKAAFCMRASVLLDEAEKVVIDRNVNSYGHCKQVVLFGGVCLFGFVCCYWCVRLFFNIEFI